MRPASRHCAGNSARAGFRNTRAPRSSRPPTRRRWKRSRSPWKTSRWCERRAACRRVAKVRCFGDLGMTTLLTPGLYRQSALPVRVTGPLARGDVALFLGYAARGPLGVPIRIESLALFETVFGPRPAEGFLWPAVKAFFENGG